MPLQKLKLQRLASQARNRERASDTVKDPVDGTSETSDAVQPEHNNTENDKSCKEALGTTEILEGVLECLPPTTLHVIHWVNKRFQDVIVKSPRIQKKMFHRINNEPGIQWTFLRIDNKPSSLWQFYDPSRSWKLGTWTPDKRSGIHHSPKDLITPVDINPFLVKDEFAEPLHTAFNSEVKGTLTRGVILYLDHNRASKLSQVGQVDSIFRGLISDPHCPKIRVTLRFELGRVRPTLIDVNSVVESDSLLTIGDAILRSLDEPGSIGIQWKGNKRSAMIRYEYRKGLPRHLLMELKHESGFEVYFQPRETIFRLSHAVAPTDEEKATIGSRHVNRQGRVGTRIAY